MSSTYEFWLLDDNGKKIKLLNNYAFFSYSRAINNLGVLQIGFPFEEWIKLVNTPIFKPDWRIDVQRSPGFGYPMRREQTYLLRKYAIYTRDADDMQMIILYGHDAKDLLERRFVIQPAGYSQTLKTDFIDDMMKEIVREQMVYGSALDVDAVIDNTRAFPSGEFEVQADLSLGPSVTQTFPDRNVLDVIKELSDISKQLYNDNSLLYRKIYFDVVPAKLANDIFGFRFETFADLYGEDRTTGTVFSVENNNLEAPYYSKDHLEEINAVIVKGFGRGDSRPWDQVTNDAALNQSRWNRRETFEDASTEPDQDNLADYGYGVLYANEAQENITAVFLNTPGSETLPRSLYGVDWDLGDLLPVQYAGVQLNVEVVIVYVAMNESGEETVTGRNEVTEGIS